MFRHELPFDRSSLTRWRQRLGEKQIAALLQESLSVAHRSGAIAIEDLERVAVDTTVQEKAVAHPTDARLTHRAIEKLVELAKREGVELRQSYLRVAKRAAIMVGRYTHAHQFKRARHLSLRDSEDDFAIRAYSNTISRFERRAVPAQGTGAD